MGVILTGMDIPESCEKCEIEMHKETDYGDEYAFECPVYIKVIWRKQEKKKDLIIAL